VRLPVAHDLCGDTALHRRRATSYYFLFRKEMLPCEHVEWRKRKMSGSRCLCVVGVGVGSFGSGRRLDAVAVLEQVRVRLLEVDERARHPGDLRDMGPAPGPTPARVGTLREPSNEGRDAGGTLRWQAKHSPITEELQGSTNFRPHIFSA